MQFVGDGFLVCAEEFESKDKATGKLTKKYKYSFLVGDFDKWLSSPVLTSYISDKPLLKGDERFMSKVKVLVKIETKLEINDKGKYVEAQRPVYALVDQNIKE